MADNHREIKLYKNGVLIGIKRSEPPFRTRSLGFFPDYSISFTKDTAHTKPVFKGNAK